MKRETGSRVASQRTDDRQSSDTQGREDQGTSKRDPGRIDNPSAKDKGGDDDDAEHDKKIDDGEGDKGDDRKLKSRLPILIAAVLVVVAIIAGITYWLLNRGLESTDDACTEGDAVAIAARVSGYVTELNVDDNTIVKAGDLLLRIDPRDSITKRNQAVANLSLARSQLASARTDLDIARVRVPATLAQAQAQLAQAQANQAQAEQEYRRQKSVDPRATTQSSVDQAAAQLKSNGVNVSLAQAQVQVAGLVPQNIEASADVVSQRQAQVAQAEASLAQADLTLSYTDVRAPQDGRITRRNVNLGSYAQEGMQIFYIVTPNVWVTANFKGNQLADMRPGQPVPITVDAYPNLRLRGHVESIQGGSGARFTAFPAENATGNFVKIVRRVPVKVVIDGGLGDRNNVPLGLSVISTVTVR